MTTCLRDLPPFEFSLILLHYDAMLRAERGYDAFSHATHFLLNVTLAADVALRARVAAVRRYVDGNLYRHLCLRQWRYWPGGDVAHGHFSSVLDTCHAVPVAAGAPPHSVAWSAPNSPISLPFIKCLFEAQKASNWFEIYKKRLRIENQILEIIFNEKNK